MLDEQQLKILSQVAQGAQNVQICLGDGTQNNYYNTSAPASAAKPPIQEAEVVVADATTATERTATERTAAAAADGTIATATEPTATGREAAEELCLFIHPRLYNEEGKEIDRQIRNLVRRRDILTICQFLGELDKQKKVLLPPQPLKAYEELKRLGMPGEETKGFTYKNFQNYYRK